MACNKNENFSPDIRTTFRSIILRDETDYKETVEIRRVFVHQDFAFPSLYNDIAVAEMGTKIFRIALTVILETYTLRT